MAVALLHPIVVVLFCWYPCPCLRALSGSRSPLRSLRGLKPKGSRVNPPITDVTVYTGTVRLKTGLFPSSLLPNQQHLFFKERGFFCPSSSLARLFSSHRWTGQLLNPPSFPSGNYLSRYDSMALHFVSEHNLGFCRANILSCTPYTLLIVVKYMYLYGSKRTYNHQIARFARIAIFDQVFSVRNQ